MSAMPANNADLVREAVTRAFIKRDTTVFAEYWSEDYKQHNPMFADGSEHLASAIEHLPPGFRYDIGPVVSEGNLVMVHGRYVGWTEKPTIAVDISRVEGGKIVEHWDVLQEEVPADKTVSGRPMFPAG